MDYRGISKHMNSLCEAVRGWVGQTAQRGSTLLLGALMALLPSAAMASSEGNVVLKFTQQANAYL